jgi:acetolactate synthase-1/2/3 large subunit
VRSARFTVGQIAAAWPGSRALNARIEHPDQFGDAYAEAIRSTIPTVLDVVINRDTGIPVTGTWQMPPIPEVQPTFGTRKIRHR